VSKTFALDFQVRDYELDQYGVVNNAVYLNYLEHTRHEFLIAIGIDAAQVARDGEALALHEIHATFRRPLRSRERFRVSVHVAELRGARAVLAQRIVRLPGEELVLEATAVAVFLNGAGKPVRIAPAIREAFAPYVAAEP
jgi:YbgC/YbaW family acyl-CoA thioester hydrolase